MTKKRIADLLKENDDLKRQVSLRNEEAAQKSMQVPSISEEQLIELKDELHHTHTALEDAQDRNLLLEEEIESWITRGHEMEQEIRSLKEDIETMEEKAASSKQTIAIVEETAGEARAEAEEAQQALENMKREHQAKLEQLEHSHRQALQAMNERASKAESTAKQALSDMEHMSPTAAGGEVPNLMESSHSDDGDSDDDDEEDSNEGEKAQAKQARILEEAVARRKSKTGVAKKSWFAGLVGEEEELTEDQKKIRELENVNAEQLREINSLKSEVVRLRSTYNETMYTSKKRIETLETENEAHLLKVQALEDALTKAEL